MRDDRLKAALGYRRFTGIPRILLFDSSYLVVNDVKDGAETLGYNVETISVNRLGPAPGNFVAQLLKCVVQFQPDFILTINHLGFDEQGVLAELLARYEIPTASWFVDHPLPILGGAPRNATDFSQIFCFERTALKWLAMAGFSRARYLPTGSNRRYFSKTNSRSKEASELAVPLSFAGNSWWSKARLEPPKTIRKDAVKFCQKHTVDRQWVASHLPTAVAEFKPTTAHPRARYAAVQVALAEASMRARGRFARRLTDAGLTLFGDPHWRKLAPKLDLRPFVSYEKGLPRLFASSDVNLNITAEQMPTAVNQRVWDVPSAGGFLLTDAQADALEYFKEDEEIAVYRDFDEAVDKARFYGDRPDLRQQIAKRAHQKIIGAHGVTHRVSEIVTVMREAYK